MFRAMQSSLCGDCSLSDIEVPTSPAPESLRSNHTVSTTQALSIRTAISSAQHDISRVDSGIACLVGTTLELRQKRDALETFITMHKALVSPVHYMPPEILSEIFLYCVAMVLFEPASGSRGLYLDKTPLLLGKICSGWRNVSLSTLRLWTFFRLRAKSQHLEAHVLLAETWLARAGACPLSIALDYYHGGDISLKHQENQKNT
jgi:hypothetical protein